VRHAEKRARVHPLHDRASRRRRGKSVIGRRLTVRLVVVVGQVLGAAEHLAAVVAERVDSSLDAQPAEVALECARDVCLAAGCISGVSRRAYRAGRR
jgi:hypothetical protein